MYNSITIVGNLGRDPEIKQTSKGGNYAILSVATHRKMAGEKQTEWHKVVVWDEKIADVLQNCLAQDGLSERECITKNTKYFVMRGNIKKVAALCNHLEERWRGECYFNTAEFLVQSKGSSGYSEGVDLCLSAEPFVKNCLEHLIMQLAQFAPSSLTSRREHWHKIYSAENAIRSAWSFRDKLLMKENIERLWSEALGISYFNSNPVTGDPFDALEERHHPHIRSAAMRRLLAINSPNTKSLDDWIQLAEKVEKGSM